MRTRSYYATVLVVTLHEDKAILIFLSSSSALFIAVGDHFGPITLAVGICSGLEFALLFHWERSPSFADDLSEFLEIVLFL